MCIRDRSQEGAFGSLPTSGTVFVSVANRDKRTLMLPIMRLADLGFSILATAGTAQMLQRNGVECEVVAKLSQVNDDNESTATRSVVDYINEGAIDLILNTPAGSAGARHDGYDIRAAAVNMNVPAITTVQGCVAAVQGIAALQGAETTVRAIQDIKH